MKIKRNPLELLRTYAVITLGCAVYAVGFCWCYQTNSIAFGGVTGIAQIINALLPWAPIGVTVIVLNTPLFLLGWWLLGGHLLVSSLYAMAVSSVMLDLLDFFVEFPSMDQMLATVLGGVSMGLSLGLIFMEGSTTGGTDLLARLMKIKLTWLPMGKLVMVVDLVVVASAAVVFRRLEAALYGGIALYITSIVMDGVLYGMDNAKVAYIISDHSEEILHAIIHDMDRGATILRGEGGYSRVNKNVIMCAFKQRQIVGLKRIILEVDPTAFLIVCQAHEVLGDGFRSYSQNDL